MQSWMNVSWKLLLPSIMTIVISTAASAGWEVVGSNTNYPRDPFFQTNASDSAKKPPTAYSSASFPNQYANLGSSAIPLYAISISGSLKENLERIMGRYHWRVIWKSDSDYNFDGKITGSSLPNAIEKLLKPFPLKATMYMANRTLMVEPRPTYRVQE